LPSAKEAISAPILRRLTLGLNIIHVKLVMRQAVFPYSWSICAAPLTRSNLCMSTTGSPS
jgi:hypothetical protein